MTEHYLSSGEKTSVALAYRLALNKIVQKVSTGMSSNLLILDEPTDGFSKEQLGNVREILDELECPQIIIVSHEKELESFADQIFGPFGFIPEGDFSGSRPFPTRGASSAGFSAKAEARIHRLGVGLL